MFPYIKRSASLSYSVAECLHTTFMIFALGAYGSKINSDPSFNALVLELIMIVVLLHDAKCSMTEPQADTSCAISQRLINIHPSRNTELYFAEFIPNNGLIKLQELWRRAFLSHSSEINYHRASHNFTFIAKYSRKLCRA